MKRRNLLKYLACGAAVTGLPLGSVVRAQNDRQFRFGLQLSTLNSLMAGDFEGSLARTREIGYDMVEFSAGGFLGRDRDLVKGYLEKYGLFAPVGRVTPDYPAGYFTMDSAQRRRISTQFFGVDRIVSNVRFALDQALFMEQNYLNLPAGPREEFGTRAQVENLARVFNEAGAICKEQGVLFGYHNHAFEFEKVDGILPYDLLLAETDPELVSFQLDSYWIRKGGGDLLDYVTKHPGRFPTCHLKDITADGNFEDVGHGIIDFPEFIAAAIDNGAKYFFVERDGPSQPLESVIRSYNYLANIGPV